MCYLSLYRTKDCKLYYKSLVLNCARLIEITLAVMAGLIHAHINTYVYTIVASAGAFSEASIHTHTLAHNDVSCLLCVLLYVRIYIPELCYVFHVHALALIRYIVIPVEQRVMELAALLPRLNPHFGSLCVKNTTYP